MKWFVNQKLGTKLMTGFILVAVITAVVGFFGVRKINQIDSADTQMFEKAAVPLSLLGSATSMYQQVRVNSRDLLATDNAATRQKILDSIRELRKGLDEKAQAFKDPVN